MTDESYEVEIVDDTSTYVEDDAVTDDKSAEQQAAAQAKAEQDKIDVEEAKNKTADKMTRSERKKFLRERVDELTRRYRAEETQRQTAQRELEQEREQFQTQAKTFQSAQAENARVVYQTLADNKRLLEANLALARERGDVKTENQIQDRLTDARDKMGRLKGHFPDVEKETASQPTAQQPEPGATPQAQPAKAAALPDAAKTWIDTNDFLKTRQDLHPLINQINNVLVAKGMDNAKPEFYAELTKRLKDELPKDVADKLKGAAAVDDDWDALIGPDDEADESDDALDAGQQARQEQQPTPRQTQTVGDGGRGAPPPAGGKRKVRLTSDQVRTADRLGVSREAYAAQVARQPTNTGYTVIGE